MREGYGRQAREEVKGDLFYDLEGRPPFHSPSPCELSKAGLKGCGCICISVSQEKEPSNEVRPDQELIPSRQYNHLDRYPTAGFSRGEDSIGSWD